MMQVAIDLFRIDNKERLGKPEYREVDELLKSTSASINMHFI